MILLLVPSASGAAGPLLPPVPEATSAGDRVRASTLRAIALHIPKTGGATLNFFLENCSSVQVQPHDGRAHELTVRAALDLCPTCDVIVSLRQPAQRAISEHMWQRGYGSRTKSGGEESRVPPDLDILAEMSGNWPADGRQAHYFAGVSEHDRNTRVRAVCSLDDELPKVAAYYGCKGSSTAPVGSYHESGAGEYLNATQQAQVATSRYPEDLALWEHFCVAATARAWPNVQGTAAAAVLGSESPRATSALLESSEGSRAETTDSRGRVETVPPSELGLPQLMVIGFQKAGTTFLRYLLAMHPEIRTKCTSLMQGCDDVSDPDVAASKGCIPGAHEAHFFDFHFGGKTAESLNITEVRRAYAEWLGAPTLGAPTLGCPATGAERIVFDETPSYSRLEADRIRLINSTVPPNTKFVALVRDPMEVKKSHRKMVACMSGAPTENHCTLSRVESDPLVDDRRWGANYSGHLREWRDVVGAPRLRVVLFDDLVGRTLSAYNGILDFVGLPALRELPWIREVPTQPQAEMHCRHAECGEALQGAILAKFEDPALCKPLAAEARKDLEALRKELGIDTPASWATCNGRSALAVE